MNKMDYVEGELFHIIHSALWKINERRSEDNKIEILDREIGVALDFLKGHLEEVFITPGWVE